MDLPVLGIAEARRGLSALVDGLVEDPNGVAIIGSHRKPQAAVLPYSTYLQLKRSADNEARTVGLAEVKARAELIRRLGSTWGMHTIAVFGSVARGEERPDSDIDILVDADPGRSYFDIAGFELDLEQIFHRPVDVVSRDALDPARKRDKAMLDDAVLL